MPPRRRAESKPTAAVALVRISDDRDGSAVGVGRQEEDCRALADRLGWRITEVVVENDTSAFSTRQGHDSDGLPTRATKRPEFRRVLRQLHEGRNDALIVYDLDRLTRQPRDLEALIDLAEVRAVPVAVVTGDVDVSTSGGRAMARVLVAFANKSSEDTARRVARAARQRAERGAPKVDGFRPYGYDRAMNPVPDEAAVIREVADRILAGDSVRSIAASLNARGIRPMRAAKWANPSVKSIVRKPTVAGLRSYTPTNLAEREQYGTTLYDGDWTPILDRETWDAVCAMLDEAGGTRTRGASTQYLLSGIALCGACGSRLYVGAGRASRVYRCNECHGVTRSVPWVDEQVGGVVKALLARPEVKAAKDRRSGLRRTPPAVELAALRDQRATFLRDLGTRLHPDDIVQRLAAFDERIAELEGLPTASLAAVRLVKPREFDDLPLARQRAIVSALVRVEVLPAGKGRTRDPESLRIVPAY